MDEQLQLTSVISENSFVVNEEEILESNSYIKVLGVGGAGTNAVNNMDKKINGVDLYVCNTDATSLNASPVRNKISLGKLGAGNNPEVGRQAAEENREKIKQIFGENTRMLFITAGMGGGTGTGASPVVAEIAKSIELPDNNEKILVVGVVTLPLSFEGRKRKQQAEEGIKRLKEFVDCIIIVNTDKLRGRKGLSLSAAFAQADDVLLTAVKGISEIITNVGLVQVDFRDVQSVMKDSGVALMGMGIAEGENRAMEAIKAATTSELLNDNDISKTKNVLLTFTCSHEHEITMDEIEVITDYIADQTNEDVDTIWGISYNESIGEKLSITLIATGFESKDIDIPSTRRIGMDTTTLKQPTQTPVAGTTSTTSSMTEMTITTKAPEPVSAPISTPTPVAKTEEKVVIEVDVNMNPIENKAKTFEQVETSGIQPAISVAQPIFRQDPITQIQVKPQQSSDIRPSDLSASRTTASKDFNQRMEQIKKLKELMSTDEGLEQIINSHPDAGNNYDISQSFSAPKQQSSFAINSMGAVGITANSAIDAQVD